MNGTALGRPAKRGSKTHAALAAALALVCSFGGLRTAAGQSEPDELARRHFESGAAYFEEAEYLEALKAFEKAYELSKRSAILLNISIVQERLNNLPAAIAALDDYLERTPDDGEVETLRRRRDNLQKRLESGQGRTDGETGTGSAAGATDKPLVLPEPLAPQDPKSPPAHSPTAHAPEPWLTYAFVGVGAATALGALATGIAAQLEYDDLKGRCAPRCSKADTAPGQTLAVTSTILTGLSVVTLGVGAWLWFKPSQEPSVPSVSLMGGPDLALAQARWSF
jgi:tetratricopeptide (TPR) repeat protein